MVQQFFEELSRCLRKEQIESHNQEDRRLEIFLHGQPALFVSPEHDVFLLPAESNNPEANELYGKKYCKESPTLDELPLQQAVLAAINASMSGRKVLADQLVDAMEQELAPIPGESMSLGDIDRAVTELGKQFDTLLAEAANGNADEYAERFRAISATMEELKRRKAAILNIRKEQEQIGRRIHAAASAMTAVTVGITEWDDGVVYQMLEKVTVLADNRIKVTFRNGVEIEQVVDQPKRRKFT